MALYFCALRRGWLCCLGLTVIFLAAPQRVAAETAPKAEIKWEAWSDKIFERAKAEKRLVLLDLGAVWCHWCHVMDEITYQDPEVIRLMGEGYIAVRVDQDARPDLANRYEDYGWPATIVFASDGSEIAKRRGYLPPKPMASMLQAFIDDPTKGPSAQGEEVVLTAASEAALSETQRLAMRELFLKAYDSKVGGWGDVHKYLSWDSLEYCLSEGAAGDRVLEGMAQQTLTAGLKLIDPVWGGLYQYSTDGDWDHPHFEKIMPFQAENMRVFSLAATLRGEEKWLLPAQQIRGFLKKFLTSPEGSFYTSQDADVVPGEHSGEYFALGDEVRRKLGVPRIDTHIYSRENGLAITGLCALYAASGDAGCLEEARKAADWILANRVLPGGGFRHGTSDVGGPFLSDTVAMARAFLSLYTVTAERVWLLHAEAAAAFIEKTFRGPTGYVTAASAPAAPLAPKPQVDENLAVARLTILLHHHTGSEVDRVMAEHAMRYLAAPSVVAQQGYSTAGILLADRELRKEPVHITVVGPKDQPAAQALFAEALRAAPAAALIEWLDVKEGPLPRPDASFPSLREPAAFLCSNGSCSPPMTTPLQLRQKLARLRP